MIKHSHIYTSDGMFTGVLGHILEQSDSYKSSNFCFNSSLYNDIMMGREQNRDPWDNHSMDKDHWSHKYIQHIEIADRSFEWLNSFVDSFNHPTVFGISYGAYSKKDSWNNKQVQHIGSKYNREMTLIYFHCYFCREFNTDDVIESLDMHIHDHFQDDPEYRKYAMEKFGNAAIQISKSEPIEFWQLQSCYHHGYEGIPDKNRKDEFIEHITSSNKQSSIFLDNNDVYTIDPFDIDMYSICDKLEIQPNKKMNRSINQWNKFTKKILNDIQV